MKKKSKGHTPDRHHSKASKRGHMTPPTKDPLVPKGCDHFGHFGEDYMHGGDMGASASGPASQSSSVGGHSAIGGDGDADDY